jgi:hypothetical protein
VSIQQIDSAFSKAMIAMLAAMELKKRRRIDKSLTEKIDALKAEKEESAISLTEQLANIDEGIRQWVVVRDAAAKEKSVEDTADAIRNLKRLRADREAIEVKANAASKEVDQLSECCDLLDCATRDWHSWKFEKQQRLVRLIVEHATIEELTPHMLKLVVLFSEPVNTVMTFHIYRARGSKSAYTPEENATLRRLYPTADRAIVLEKLPSRTWESIIIQATTELHLERNTRANTSDIPKNLTYSDAQLLRSLGLPVQPLDQPIWTIDTDDNQLRSVRKQMLMR